MKKILFLLLTLPLFLACSNDESDLKGTKWTYKVYDGEYYTMEILEFTSNTDCIWTTITTKVFIDDTNIQIIGESDMTKHIETQFSYLIKNEEITLSNTSNNTNIKATINSDYSTIAIGDKIFEKQ